MIDRTVNDVVLITLPDAAGHIAIAVFTREVRCGFGEAIADIA
jgi:hypothetical protein